MIDDVIATGGTALAGIELVRSYEPEIIEFCAAIDLPGLGGSERIRALGVPVRALVEVGE
jgi:adenine phosphoribosyltransferase